MVKKVDVCTSFYRLSEGVQIGISDGIDCAQIAALLCVLYVTCLCDWKGAAIL